MCDCDFTNKTLQISALLIIIYRDNSMQKWVLLYEYMHVVSFQYQKWLYGWYKYTEVKQYKKDCSG